MRKVKKITTIDDIQARLDKIEQLESESTSASNNRNYELESKFAAYRHARAKKRNAHGDFTYEDVYDTIIQEELDWNLKQQLKVSPEERYQDKKKAWYYHESCYYKRNN